MLYDGFSNPWEHVRLLSDRPRNDKMVALLQRRAPGARVLETGCGTGLLSCIAARLGATRVYAVEPTPQAEVARELVRHNGLEDRVVVLNAPIEALPPEPVDLGFAELLNADPFVEGVLPAMDATARWVVPGGVLAPSRLRVFAALARASGSAQEARHARRELARLGATVDLDVAPVLTALATPRPYVSVSSTEAAVGPAEVVWDLPLGRGAEPEPRRIRLRAHAPGPVGGVILWFTADLDADLTLGSTPQDEGHWGCLVSAFAEERGVGVHGEVAVTFTVVDGRVEVRWAD